MYIRVNSSSSFPFLLLQSQNSDCKLLGGSIFAAYFMLSNAMYADDAIEIMDWH